MDSELIAHPPSVWPKVGIVIPAWNAKAYTLACLDSLSRLAYPAYCIAIVDNGSTDGSIEAINANFPEVAVVRNVQNSGFAYACNQGLRLHFREGADFVLLLNNDTIVAADLVSRLVEAAGDFPRAGILGPTICYADRPDTPWFTGMRLPGPLYIVRTASSGHQVKSDRPIQVDFISGCGMLITRQLFEAIGGLSEDYFMYYEDLDYCLRARSAGFERIYVPEALMWHKVSASSGGKDSPIKQYYQVKSSLVFYRRHTHGVWRWVNLCIRFSHAGWVASRQFVHGDLHLETIRYYLKGIGEAKDRARPATAADGEDS